MNAILSRAGLSADQQRALSLDTIRDEVQHTKNKLKDALASLRCLEEVVRLARGVHKSRMPLGVLAPDVQAPLAQMATDSVQIGPLLDKIETEMNTSSGSESRDTSTDEPVPTTETHPRTDIRSTVLPKSASRPLEPSSDAAPDDSTAVAILESRSQGRASSPSLAHKRGLSASSMEQNQSSSNFFLRPVASAQISRTEHLTEVDVKIEADEGRPSKRRALESHITQSQPQHTNREALNVIEDLITRQLRIPVEEREGVFYKCLASTLAIVGHAGKKKHVQLAVDNTRALIQDFFRGVSSLSSESISRLEDIRLILSVVVRAILQTNDKLDEAGLRDLHSLIGTLLEKHPGSTGSYRWWHTKLHRFIKENYNEPSKSSLAVQAEVVSLLEEVQQWRSTQDFNVSMIDKAMGVVDKALRDPFDAWKPREDSRLAELIGLLKICINSYRDSLVQRRRRGDINAWLGQMSGCSFTPTLNLSSIPPARPREFFFSRRRNFKSLDEVNDGFKLIAEAREENNFGLLTTALHSFLVKAPLTDRGFLPLRQLRVFNENVEELRRIEPEPTHSIQLQSYQELENILCLMRALMRTWPEYEECSVKAVEAALSRFPPSKRPAFVFPISAKS